MNESGTHFGSDTAFGLDSARQQTESIVRPREMEEILKRIGKDIKNSKSSHNLDTNKLQRLLSTFLDNTTDISDYVPAPKI